MQCQTVAIFPSMALIESKHSRKLLQLVRGYYHRPCHQRFACIGAIGIAMAAVALFLALLSFYCIFKRDYLKQCWTANRTSKPPRQQQMAEWPAGSAPEPQPQQLPAAAASNYSVYPEQVWQAPSSWPAAPADGQRGPASQPPANDPAVLVAGGGGGAAEPQFQPPQFSYEPAGNPHAAESGA